eukprot:GHVU01018671.1.p2 GENE.GHVU01018671.1~~GHVU01018671.1.p2  ORF type:complete len:129 (+),score=2.21 GHVU01018671.1:503-889(+)
MAWLPSSASSVHSVESPDPTRESPRWNDLSASSFHFKQTEFDDDIETNAALQLRPTGSPIPPYPDIRAARVHPSLLVERCCDCCECCRGRRIHALHQFSHVPPATALHALLPPHVLSTCVCGHVCASS